MPIVSGDRLYLRVAFKDEERQEFLYAIGTATAAGREGLKKQSRGLSGRAFRQERVWMPSVGEQLKSAREAQGKSLDDIGSDLKIAPTTAALEAET